MSEGSSGEISSIPREQVSSLSGGVMKIRFKLQSGERATTTRLICVNGRARTGEQFVHADLVWGRRHKVEIAGKAGRTFLPPHLRRHPAFLFYWPVKSPPCLRRKLLAAGCDRSPTENDLQKLFEREINHRNRFGFPHSIRLHRSLSLQTAAIESKTFN